MLYAIMSDVHANPSALEKALADAKEQGAEKVICLGDVVGYGPDPAEAVALCRESCDVVLMGNHDAAVAGSLRTDNFIEFARDGVRRHVAELSSEDIAWLRGLPYMHKGRTFAGVHGTLAEQIVGSLMRMAEIRRRLLFVGHTHHACGFVAGEGGRIRMFGPDKELAMEPKARYIVNVGSVGYPRADLDITYVLYDTRAKKVTFRHLPFDFSRYVARLEAKRVTLPLWLADHMRRMKGTD